ncbi:hypothetical protein [Pantoea sp. A4]|uniref:hypothetical protein n=1 Tax=Pantoea sp. A4 TaxID=1225184 RepID=UPI00037281DB|nr:hypothetical protein [Pantoea sp. A4]
MTRNTIYVIHSPNPTLGRSPLQRGFFLYALTEKFIKSLQRELDRLCMDYQVVADDTESDIEVLITRDPALLVCVPGLRFQFYHRGFDKQKIVWLNVIEYSSADPFSVLNRLTGQQRLD